MHSPIKVSILCLRMNMNCFAVVFSIVFVLLISVSNSVETYVTVVYETVEQAQQYADFAVFLIEFVSEKNMRVFRTFIKKAKIHKSLLMREC